MNRLTKPLVLFVVVFHLLVFVVEAFLWMRPGIHGIVLARLSDSLKVDPHEQALILKALFINQGFYNLFLAVAGIAGLALLKRGKAPAGYALIGYMCLSAAGAGLVLALSTTAYVGAFLQAAPAALALLGLARAMPTNERKTAAAL
jgi:putative membrane protein